MLSGTCNESHGDGHVVPLQPEAIEGLTYNTSTTGQRTVRTVHIQLGQHGELDSTRSCKLLDVCVGTWLLLPELVAGCTNDY